MQPDIELKRYALHSSSAVHNEAHINFESLEIICLFTCMEYENIYNTTHNQLNLQNNMYT